MIRPPRVRPDLVRRERVEAQLLRALGRCKLLLLCAPAGYGKTVALVQLLQRLPPGTAVAWVSASEEDDLHRVLTCLLAALDPFDLPWRVSPQMLPSLAAAPDGVRTVADQIAGALAAAEVERGLIVVEDVHRVNDARVFQCFDRLLAQLPPRWTLALSARESPPLSLARLRLESELVELGQAELRFRDDEASALAQGSKPALEPAQLADMQRHTQGWPVGLVAGLMSLDGEGVARAHRQAQRRMFEYLAEEVLAQLPAPMQLFLLRCSVLPRLTVQRCRHVSGDAQAAKWLDELERRQLFITVLEGEDTTLALHDLFRDFLQERLRVERPQELPQLLTRASEYETDVVARVTLLLRAGDGAAAARELMQAALPLSEVGGGAQLLRLIDEFPPSLREHSPELAFVAGLCGWQGFAFTSAQVAMRRAMEGFERDGRTELALKARMVAVLCLIATARAGEAKLLAGQAPRIDMQPDTELLFRFVSFALSAHYGPYRQTPLHLERVCELIDLHAETRSWLSGQLLHVYCGRWGVAQSMRRLADLLLRRGSDEAPLLRGRALALNARLALWQGDLAAARKLNDEAEADARWLGGVEAIMVSVRLSRAQDMQLRGDSAGMKALLTDLCEQARKSPQRRSDLLYSNLLGGFAAANGDWDLARQALQVALQRQHEYDWNSVRLGTAALRAEILLHDGDVGRALEEFRAIGPHALDWSLWAVPHERIHVGWARAELRAGNPTAAWEALAPVLAAVADSREVLGLLLCGPAALEELDVFAWPAQTPQPELEVLTRCAAQARQLRALGGPAAASPKAQAQALSAREVQVLRLVAEGQSNKHIARALNLSPHTVKRHVARILDKIDQDSRGQAAAWLHAQVAAGALP